MQTLKPTQPWNLSPKTPKPVECSQARVRLGLFVQSWSVQFIHIPAFLSPVIEFEYEFLFAFLNMLFVWS